MPFFQNGEVRIHYEVSGSGYPVLMLAPGGMRSTIDFWNRMPFNPVVDLASDFQVVAMDQRNAGESIAPISASDGWEAYAGDQLALMDHLGHRRFHAVGCCIGCSFILKLAQLAPQRITAGGMLQPIGFNPEEPNLFFNLFDGWAQEQKQQRHDVSDAALAAFRNHMFPGQAGDFVFSVTRDFVRQCQLPMLLMSGSDAPHPAVTSRELAQIAPRIEVIETWKTPATAPAASARLRAFLQEHQPR